MAVNREIMAYGQGTNLIVTRPWGLYLGGSARCPDGKVRRLKRISTTADTYSTVPAAVQARGKTVSGYVTVVEDSDGERVIEFVPYSNGKNANVFGKGV